MYQDLHPYLQPERVTYLNSKPELRFGIDVGRVSDYTVVKVLEIWPPEVIDNEVTTHLINEIDTYRIGHMNLIDQAHHIYEWINDKYIWNKERIVVEVNGLGVGLYDALNKTPFESVQGIHVNEQIKERVWMESTKYAKNKRFGIRSDSDRDHYLSMVYNTRESDGKLEFEHSDDWSALVMAWPMGKIETM